MRKIILLFGLILFPLNLYATQLRSGAKVVIGKDEVVDGNVAIGCRNLVVKGKIKGDLMAGAHSIKIEGEIEGDFWGIAQDVEIEGKVKGDVRVAGGEISVEGVVENDAIIFCSELMLDENSSINGDLKFGCGKADILGIIKKGVEGAGGEIKIGGDIEGDVELTCRELIILPSAVIDGDLHYKSKKEILVKEDAEVLGKIVHTLPEKKWEFKFPTFPKILFRILFLISAAIVGIISIALSPKHCLTIANSIKEGWWQCLLTGFIVLFCVPIAVVLVSISIVGLPLGIIVFSLYLILLYLSGIFFGLFIGEGIFKIFKLKVSPYWSIISGLVVLFFLTMIPYVGWLIRFLVLLFGLGAVVWTEISLHKRGRQDEKV